MATPSSTPTIPVAPLPDKAVRTRSSESKRSYGLDAYRGAIMLAMVSFSLGIPQVAAHFPESKTWQFFSEQVQHVEWIGCSFWDIIQPSFMFMVGVSMAYSMAARAAQGQTYGRLALHALARSVILVLLGVFLESNGAAQTNFRFVNVLSQIGLGYFFVFLLWNRHWLVQWIGVAVVLAGYWLAFYLYPAPPSNLDPTTVGLPANWQMLEGLEAHWNKNTNVAARFDQWFLNLFPRSEPFRYNAGGYQTLNFIPSIATMLFGLIAGEFLRGGRRGWVKLLVLLAFAVAGIGAGWALDQYGLCPLVKRIWTPSWTLFSAGIAAIILTAFVGLSDMTGWRKWTMPFAVVGANSLLMYCMAMLMRPWLTSSFRTHAGLRAFEIFGKTYAPMVESITALVLLWLICVWLYRRRIFIRI